MLNNFFQSIYHLAPFWLPLFGAVGVITWLVDYIVEEVYQ